LKAARYEVASDWTDSATVVPADTIDWKAVAAGDKEVRIRQLPGSGNMMGQIKFSFANDYGIYLHDTPLKGLFAKDRRTLSLGCVRVEDAKRLGRWLLQAEPTAPSDGPEQHVKLPKPVPIYLTYLTAHADSGQIAFADDVYGLDGAPEIKLATAAPTPAATETAETTAATTTSTSAQ
jgi:L,D-transpeptidase YcbB